MNPLQSSIVRNQWSQHTIVSDSYIKMASQNTSKNAIKVLLLDHLEWFHVISKFPILLFLFASTKKPLAKKKISTCRIWSWFRRKFGAASWAKSLRCTRVVQHPSCSWITKGIKCITSAQLQDQNRLKCSWCRLCRQKFQFIVKSHMQARPSPAFSQLIVENSLTALPTPLFSVEKHPFYVQHG